MRVAAFLCFPQTRYLKDKFREQLFAGQRTRFDFAHSTNRPIIVAKGTEDVLSPMRK